MKRKALLDLIILFVTFWSAWYFKSAIPGQLQGAFVVVSTSLVAFLILKKRGITYCSLGFIPRAIKRSFLSEVLQISFMIFVIQFSGILIIGTLVGYPEQGSAITNQPATILGFLLDIFILTWLVTALGEEFIFRGIILARLKVLFEDGKAHMYVVSGIQAAWFGAAHMSQGVPGILITGLIGFALGIYFLKTPRLGLWPLVVAHALIDTVVLTISFIGQ